MTLTFNNKKILYDSDGNFLTNDETDTNISFRFSYLSDKDKVAAERQANGSILSIILTFISSTFMQLALGSSIEATWLLFGTVQLVSLVPLFNLNLPSNFREYAKNLAILHGEPEALPNLFSEYVDTENLEPYNTYFELMSQCQFGNNCILDFKTTALFMNAGRKIEIWGLTLVFMYIFYILYDLFSEMKVM